MGSDQAMAGIPVIDFSDKNLRPGTSCWAMTRDNVRRSMEEQGWFIAEYDRLSLEHHEAILDGMKQMYELPYEVKIKNENHKASHGYMSVVVDGYQIHESLGIDHSTELEGCQNFTNLLWPQGNDRFCKLAHSYAKILAELEQTVMKMLFESYGIETQNLEGYVETTRYLLRLLSYRKQQNGEPNSAFVSHTDKGFMTILHQNHVRGLELRSKDGEWLVFEPSPTRFVVLAGLGIMAWSNDRIKAGYHRVVMVSDEVRYSMGFFSFNKGTIQIPEEMVDEEHPLQYKPFEHDGLLRFYELRVSQKKGSQDLLELYCGVK